ncbi:protein-tyrosine phosphatase family protein [Falsiroseomonas oryziterrae]|uniref:protein-tyrosine phosphatase family protein n=1 Tax=Falsiroseomonas oryziterrae TaxID=2911368 RepID=UPI001F1A2537|nr:tyrosine-protein phosphatase [Roseomonas sp. NPKOSM-4]
MSPRLRGTLPLPVAGRLVTITGGPFDAIPEGAFGVCLEPAAAKAWLADVALPTPDFGLPDPEALKRAVAAVLAQLEAEPERPVHVGCRAGIGRTGLFLACLARAAGVPGDALDYVRAHYRPDAAETEAQQVMARSFTWP